MCHVTNFCDTTLIIVGELIISFLDHLGDYVVDYDDDQHVQRQLQEYLDEYEASMRSKPR